MTFLDASVIIDMLEGVEDTVAVVEDRGPPYLTSAVCVLEVLEGVVGSGRTDVAATRRQFGGVRAVPFDDDLAVDAAALQDRLLDVGERMAPRDLMVAATARSTGDHLVVNDADFDTSVLTDELDITNLAT